MNVFRAAALVAGMVLLQACELATITTSRLVTPDSTGDFSGDFNVIDSGVEADASGDNGFAYQTAQVGDSNELRAMAGLLPGTTGGDAPVDASATYEGTYELARVTNIRTDGGIILGNATTDAGFITLEADFIDGTLTGEDRFLEVDGTIDGQSLGGSVSYGEIDARLTGVIGQDRAVGAFVGDTSDEIIAGGFLVEALD